MFKIPVCQIDVVTAQMVVDCPSSKRVNLGVDGQNVVPKTEGEEPSPASTLVKGPVLSK